MKVFIAALALLSSSISQAAVRTGNVSFGGIQVRVTVDPSKEFLQIGESTFRAKPISTPVGRLMIGTQRVGIMTGEETLMVRLYLDGGNGGNLSEYTCENSRLKITRETDQGKIVELKNECAYLQ